MNVEKELRLRRRARALLEDISQIRSVLNAPKPPLGYARQISALMRRILFDDHDLRDVASAMIGKIQISTPDANPYRWLQNDPRTIVFVLGSVDLYNFSIGNISVFSGGRDLLADNDLSPDSWPRVTLPLDTFCKQNCLQYRGRVFSRRTVNKFVADTSSGIHSGDPQKKEDYAILDKIRYFFTLDFQKEIPEFLTHPEVLEDRNIIIDRKLDGAIDLALLCVLSTAKCLIESEDVNRLEETIAQSF